MRPSILVADEFCPEIAAVRTSALESGFASWTPKPGEIGSSIYDGMNFKGWHSPMLRALSGAIGGARVLPNSMFFRVTTPETEKAYVHSDRADGDLTCVAYVSAHDEVSGTGFFRHRATGLREMPPFEEMHGRPHFDELKHDMVHGGDEAWEQLDFVRGIFNRAVIFEAPLFHARCPKHGIGGTPETARMVWVCHFVVG